MCAVASSAARVRKLTFGMNLSLDGYIAAPGDDLGWSVPSEELFQWWSDRVAATGLVLYGRKLWETMSSHWPTAEGARRGERAPPAGRDRRRSPERERRPRSDRSAHLPAQAARPSQRPSRAQLCC